MPKPRAIEVHHVLGALGVLGFFVLTPLARHTLPLDSLGSIASPTPDVEISYPALPTLDLDSLPDSVRLAARAVLQGAKPSALEGLESQCENLQPCGDVVEDARPSFSWTAFAPSYLLKIVDPNGQTAAEYQGSASHWQPAQPLDRGVIYTWEVAGGVKRLTAKFKVLGAAEKARLDQIRASSSDPQLIRTVSAALGLVR